MSQPALPTSQAPAAPAPQGTPGAAPQSQAAAIAEKLRGVAVGLRPDLRVSRHLQQGEIRYILQEATSFQNHQLTVEDYGVLVRVHPEKPLGQVFKELVDEGCLQSADEEGFYRFVLSLHQLGFLTLPLGDDKLLFRRHQAKKQAKRRALWSALFYCQVPLVNPDAFLDRTMRFARFLFTPWAFLAWCALIAVAGTLAIRHHQELWTPIADLLSAGNLPFLWITLVVLKVFHEFGHAYACKNFGGSVPEIGLSLMLLTPLAYMDASASWGFPRKRDRIVVTMAGMYVETILSAIALLVWLMTDHHILKPLAYNVFLLSGLTTILMNLNPLMKFDGYYAASDILEIPNLRGRAVSYTLGLFKKTVLGKLAKPSEETLGRRVLFVFFAVGVAVYRVTLVLGMAVTIAHQFLVAGLLLAGIYVAQQIWQTVVKSQKWLWTSPECAPVRRRAIVAAVALLVLPACFAVLVPLPRDVSATAVVGKEIESELSAETPGFLASVAAQEGDVVASGQGVAALENLEVAQARVQAEEAFEAARIRFEVARGGAPSRVREEEEKLALYSESYRLHQRATDLLTLRPRIAGTLLRMFEPRDVGRYVTPGETVGLVGAGRWAVRAFLTEEEVARTSPSEGHSIEFRSTADPSCSLKGFVVRVTPANLQSAPVQQLTASGGGPISVDPATGRSADTRFEVVAVLDDAGAQNIRHGMTGRLWIPCERELAVRLLYRNLLRFLQEF